MEGWIALGGAGIALVLLLEWGRGRLWGEPGRDDEGRTTSEEER